MNKIVIPLKIQLTNIQLATQHMHFSQRTAAKIVGGLTRLNRLAEQGKIEVEFGRGVWKYNAWQVLCHCADKRPKPNKDKRDNPKRRKSKESHTVNP